MFRSQHTSSPQSYRYFFYIVFLFAIVITIFCTWYVYIEAKHESENTLKARVATFAALLDPKTLSDIQGYDSDAKSAHYLTLKRSLIELARVNPDVASLYVLSIRDHHMYLVADSGEPWTTVVSPIAQSFVSAPPEVVDPLALGGFSILGPTPDTQKMWTSTLAPVYDASGSVGWLVGMDVSTKTVTRSLYLYALIPGGILMFVCLLLLTAILMHRREFKIIALRNQFVSLASRELRTPLTGIRWASETLMHDAQLPELQRSLAENMHAACIKLLGILNELMDAASIEARTLGQDHVIDVDITTIVREVVEHLSYFAKERGVSVKIVGHDTPLLIRGNTQKFFNVVTNLLNNAIKYSEKNGSVIIGTTTNGSSCTLVVRDTGIGIAPRDVDRVTQGFYRAKNATLHTTTGTGLGLYVSAETVKLYNGTMHIASEVGKGTTVTVTFPLVS